MQAAGAERIHVDVMDGQFVPPITFGDGMVRSVGSLCELPIEAHLMTHTPERQIEAFAKAGCCRFIFHIEVAPHAHRVVQAIRAHGMEAGVAINPGTPLAAVEEIASLVDAVLVMTVNPGYGGQAFLPETLGKLKRLRDRWPELDLEVDGGISPNTIRAATDAGANLFVVGSYLQEPSTISEAIVNLSRALS
jgi:ribulose-phosphate 3-epimerase